MVRNILLIIIFNSHFLFSQEIITIYGKILDSSTSQVLPYASISILDKSIGTTSNSSGDFKLIIPIESEIDTIQISMLGYETYKEVVRKLKNIHEFKLVPKVFSIDEVNVKAYTAKEIVKKAFKNVNKNYHQQPALYDLFYREFWKKDSTYVRSIEADANMYYKGFQHSFDGLQFKINNLSKSNGYYDGVTINELDLSNEIIGFTFRYFKKYSYKIDSLTYYNGHLVYVISAINQKNQKEWEKQYILVENENGEITEIETNDSMLVDNYCSNSLIYYITTDKLKILKIKRNADCLNNKNRSFVADFICEKAEINLSFILYENIVYIDHFSKFYQDVHYLNGDINLKNYTSYLFCEFYVNNIKSENVTELLKEEQHNRHKDLYEQKFKYDPEFWKNYNYLVDDSLRKKVFEDIGRLDSLNRK